MCLTLLRGQRLRWKLVDNWARTARCIEVYSRAPLPLFSPLCASSHAMTSRLLAPPPGRVASQWLPSYQTKTTKKFIFYLPPSSSPLYSECWHKEKRNYSWVSLQRWEHLRVTFICPSHQNSWFYSMLYTAPFHLVISSQRVKKQRKTINGSIITSPNRNGRADVQK